MAPIQNNAKVVSTCNQRITGLTKLVNPKSTIKVGKQTMKVADVIAVYQSCIDARSELVSKRAMFEGAVDVRDQADLVRRTIDEGLKAWAAYQYGLDSQEALELGFTPRKVGVRSAATKALAVEKLRATREARRTMGKREREKVKGVIETPREPSPPSPDPVTASPPAVTTTNGAATH